MWKRWTVAVVTVAAMVGGWSALSTRVEESRRQAYAWDLVEHLDPHGGDAFDQTFKELHELGESAVPALISLIRDDCSSISTYAGITLDGLAGGSIAHYVTALDHDNPHVRSAAALRLTVLGMERPHTDEFVQIARSAIPRLLEMLGDEDDGVYEHAGSAVIYLVGPEDDALIPELLDALRRQSARFARRSSSAGSMFHYDMAYALAAIGPEALPALREALYDPLDETREAAMEGLRRMGSDAAPAVPDLVGIVREQVRHWPLEAPKFEAEMEIAALTGSSPGIPLLFEASRALGAIGEAAAPAVPILVEWVKSDHVPRRWQAVDALGHIGPAAQEAVPALINLLMEEELDFRAADALGRIGPEAIPASLDALDDRRTRGGALRALGLMGQKALAAADTVQEVFEISDGRMLCEAAAALWRMGHNAGPALAALANECPSYREPLRSPGPGAAEALPDLFRRLVDAPSQHDYHAAMAKLGDAAIPFLTEGLMHEDPEVRRASAWAVENSVGDSGPTVTILAQWLLDSDDWVRRRAAYALRHAGPTAEAALPELTAALMHEQDEGLQSTMLTILSRIPGGVEAAQPAVQRVQRDGRLISSLQAEHLLSKIAEPED